MSVFKRGEVYWYEFSFNGARVRESVKTASKTLAREAERARRRELELSFNKISKRKVSPLFSVAAREWVKGKTAVAPGSLDRFEHHVKTLTAEFGGRLLCDLDADDVSALQRKRASEKKAPRTINYEIGVLRQILRAHGLWGAISDRIKSLREAHDVGRAIPREDEAKLIDAIRACRAPAMLPLFLLSIDTGLRTSEARSLRIRDLSLEWRDGVIVAGRLTVPKSKTDAGAGRVIPLTRRVCAVLTLWLSRFPDAPADSYVFPHHKVGLAGNSRQPVIWDVKPDLPIGEWKKTWQRVREAAGLDYRWHDLRHSFVSRLAENPAVSETTITALAGHVSRKMLEHYSHIRVQAKETAIRGLEQADERADFGVVPPQNPPQLLRPDALN